MPSFDCLVLSNCDSSLDYTLQEFLLNLLHNHPQIEQLILPPFFHIKHPVQWQLTVLTELHQVRKGRLPFDQPQDDYLAAVGVSS
jgi:hypothetical protein